MLFDIRPLFGDSLQYGDYVLEIIRTTVDTGPQIRASILLRNEDIDTLVKHLGTVRPLPEDLVYRTGLKTVRHNNVGGLTSLNLRSESTNLTVTIPRTVTARLRHTLRSVATNRKDA